MERIRINPKRIAMVNGGCFYLNSAVESVFKSRKKVLEQGLICSGFICKNDNVLTVFF